MMVGAGGRMHQKDPDVHQYSATHPLMALPWQDKTQL
jgi:hypothetical protein